jgi:alpha-tubulin suppressor-like RCC1 family protein
MRIGSRLVVLCLALVSGLVLAGSLVGAAVPVARAANGGVQDPGFESLVPPGSAEAAQGWTILSQPVAGNVTLRQKDGPTEYPVFSPTGTSVSARTGSWMLRFGFPKGTDMHQVKGITKVQSQTFLSDGSDIGVSYRVFSWEHNDTDAFIIDVKDLDANGASVGTLADKEILDVTGTSVVTGLVKLPYTLDLHVEPRQVKSKDTAWQDLRITGLPNNHHLVVVYTLDTNTTASHDSWVYVDMDTIPPATTASASPAANAAGWNNGPVSVTLSASDPVSGVLGTYYQVGSGAKQTYSDKAKPVLSAGGETTFTYWSVDAVGNAEAAKTFTVKIDATPPPPITVSAADPAANLLGWNTGPVTLTFAAGAGASGLAAVEYKLDADDWRPVLPLAVPYRLVVTGDGHHRVGYRSTSVAGVTNTPGWRDVSIDGVAPHFAITAPADGATFDGALPALAFTASDALSGLVDGSTTVTLDDRATALGSGGALPALEAGSHTLTVTAIDRAGNEQSVTSKFTVSGGTPPLSSAFEIAADGPYEGGIVGLYADATGNSTGSEEGKTWEWSVSADSVEQTTTVGPVAFLTLADAGPYDVKLTVTDTATGQQSVTTKTVTAAPQAPWVTALNVEVIDGQPAKLVGRFLDPGWEQAHHASWSLTDKAGAAVAPVSATVFEDNFPAMDSGYVEGVTPALHANLGPYTGHLAMTDSTGASTTVDFEVKVVDAGQDTDEGRPGSDTIAGNGESPEVRGGQVHLSYIKSANDVDIYEVKTPSGDLLPYGTEILVTLRDLPEDYDLALIRDLGGEVNADAGLEAASVSSVAAQSYVDAPVRRGTEWDGTPVRRGTDWSDLPVRRGTDWSDLPVRRGTDWWDIPVRRGTEWDGSPVRRGTPFIDSVFLDTPVRRGTDWEAIPVRRGTEWEGVPVRRGTGYVRPPLQGMYFDRLSLTKQSLDGYSFLDMGYTGLGSNTASGSTLTFAALGFDNAAMKGKSIVDFSAHIGTESEVVYAETTYANAHTYIAVKGANGASSETEPYALQVETSLPLSIYDALDATGVTGTVVVDEAHQTTETSATVVRPPAAPGPLTLFVTQGVRFDALYGDKTYSDTPEGQPFEHTVVPALQDACNDQDGLVRGEVLSVPSSWYDAWDLKPWSTVEANAVAEKIRGEIRTYLAAHPTIKYVVLVGSDEIVPQYRVQDETVLANEQDYFPRSWLKAKGGVAASMAAGKVLTDDYYVDARPIPYNWRELYVPDLAVSRLIETPAQIKGVIDRFLEARGTLSGGSSVVTGQDFMMDGAQRVCDILKAAQLDPKMETPDTWTVGNIVADLLSGQKNVGNLNGHFNHYGGISAAGYNTSSLTGEFLTSTAIKNATSFVGKLVFTMGCHAGLSVPDDQGDVAADYSGDLDPRLDVAQAMAIRQGVLVGSTGYGYGDSEGIAGTEALIGTFADQARTSDADSPAVPSTSATAPGRPETGQPIGLALAAAKRQYLGSLTTITPYDEKSSVQFTMYGMPQYRLPCKTQAPAEGLQSSGFNPQSASYDGHLEPKDFVLTVVDAGKQDKTYEPVKLVESSVDPTARYLTAGGDSQATFGRPIQPRVVIDLDSTGGNPVKSAVVMGGTYIDVPAFNPAISRWTYEWETNAKEFQVSTDGWWPEKPVAVRTIGSGADMEQRLIVLPGQFLATSAAGAPVLGTERIWTSLKVELVRGTAADTTPPTVSSVTLSRSDDTAPVVAHVVAADAAGVARIDLTQVGTSPAAFKSASVSGSGPYDVSMWLPGVFAENVALTVAVTDAKGNTTTVTAKGAQITLGPSGTMILNGGNATTYASVVSLDSSGVSGATEMRTSTDNANWSAWRSFSANSVAALTGLPGDMTIHVQYRGAGLAVLDLSAPVHRSPVPIAAGAEHSVALAADGVLWAWGWDRSGQLGDGATANQTSPERVGGAGIWVSLAAGDEHTLGLKPDGTLWAWGTGGSGQLGDGTVDPHLSPNQVGTDTHWAAIAAGREHSLAIKSDGSLWGWGYNGYGQLGDNLTNQYRSPVRIGSDTDWVSVAAGSFHTLALKSDGTLWSCGYNSYGQLGDGSTNDSHALLQVGSDHDWAVIAAGESYDLAIKADGSLWAWGHNDSSQLGDGSTTDSHVPLRIGADTHWAAVNATVDSSLALKTDGTLWGWGSNNGLLGDGTYSARSTPVRVDAETDWAAIASGSMHSMALKSDGTVRTAGNNSNGQLGDPGTTMTNVRISVFDRATTTPPSGTMTLNGGAAQTYSAVVAVDSSGVNGATEMRTSTDGTTWSAWRPFSARTLVRLPGRPGAATVYAQYRNSSPTVLDLSAPVTLSPLTLSLGSDDSLTVRSDGTLWSWGRNDHGQLAQGDAADRHAPVRVGSDTWLAMDAGWYHGVGVKADGSLYAWGYNSGGTVGDGTSGIDRRDVTHVGTDADWATVAAGPDSSFAVKTNGSLWAWGWNGNGVLGDGSTTNRLAPVRIGTDNDWSAISAGWLHTLALKTDGSLWAWGSQYQTGIGDSMNHASPVQVGSATDWVAIAAGSSSSLALKSDGSLWSWGSNTLGQLGLGDTAVRLTPTRVGTHFWAAIAVGENQAFAVKADGSLWAWGRNDDGQLGLGDTGQRTSPVRVGTGTGWVIVGSGERHTLAMQNDGSLWAWGGNSNGGLGDGTITPAPQPEQVSSLLAGVPSGSMTLNDGAVQTYNSVVTLDSSGVTGATEMRTSTDGVVWTAWRPFLADSLVALPGLPGSKTVRVQYRSPGGGIERSGSVDLATEKVACGHGHDLALRADGALHAWGDNSYGQLGDGTIVSQHSPKLIGTGYAAVAAGTSTSFALKADGSLYAWGYNGGGEVGDGTTTDQHSPKLIGTGYAAIAGGGEHTLALMADGSLYAWGNNSYGQLGDGTTTAQHAPELVGTGYSAIAAGGYHSMALKTDGSLYAWGNNSSGQLGDGTTAAQHAPELIGTGYVMIAGSGYHSLALRADGNLYAWGANDNGQLGDGTTTVQHAPELIGTGYRAIATGVWHGLALKGDGGSLYAWGRNQEGQLGDGTINEQDTPELIGSGYAALSCGTYHSLGVKADGSLSAWGDNGFGQLGDGTTTQNLVPKRVFSLSGPLVTSPNGLESWVIGEAHSITWSPCSGGAVKIELSRDNGGSWETLFASTANDGTESWSVAGEATSQALVRISNASGSDTSDADFTIALFAAHADYAAGTTARSVAVGDFNGDGRQDLATANDDANTLSILLGSGTGTFATKVDYATGSNPHALAVGDFNSDGKQDLAVANFTAKSVSILLGSGTGTFAAKVDYAIGTSPGAVAVGDFNGDGKQDLATGNNTGSVSILLGSGTGTFATNVDYATGLYPFSIAVGDFNGDGNQDLAAANASDNTVSILLGSGTGTFATNVDYATGFSPYSIAVGDFNGDGTQDLATANMFGNTVSVLLGSGIGTFATNVDYATGRYPGSVAVGDFNSDGKQDLATTNYNDNTVSILQGTGTGTFATKVDHATGLHPYSVAVGDFNGDGAQDLATANIDGASVSILLNATPAPGLLQFAGKVPHATGAGPHGSVAVDLDADGIQDLVTVNSGAATVSVLKGAGGGAFLAKADTATGVAPFAVASADLNRDGKQDVVTANQGDGSVSVLLGNGDGTLRAKVDYTAGVQACGVAVADVNKDGRQDVLTANAGGDSVSVFLGNGDGTLQARHDLAAGDGAFAVAVADFNADGKADLAVADSNAGAVSIIVGKGDGTFGPRVEYATGSGALSIAATDVNTDGKADIAVVSFGANTVGVLLGNGDGTLQAKVDYATGAGPFAVALADVSGDGKMDLVTADQGANAISVLEGDGHGVFAAKADFPTGTQPMGVTVADLDGDGEKDVATPDYGDSTMSVLLNTTVR